MDTARQGGGPSPAALLDRVDARDPRSAELVRAILAHAAGAQDAELHNRLLRQMVIAYADSQKELMRLNRELARRQRQIDRDLTAAAGIQQSLLPQVAPVAPHLKVAWKFDPCDQVGGDIFNLFMLDEHHLGAYMLDVSGHGVPAALLTVSVVQTLQPAGTEFTKRRLDRPPYYEIIGPGEVLAGLNREYPFERFEKYLSIVYLVIDTRTGRLTYSNGGHPPPVLLRRDGSVQALDQGGGIIGIQAAAAFDTGEQTLASGDRLVIYTDGVTEHTRDQEEAFGLQRLIDVAQDCSDRRPEAILATLHAAVLAFDPGRRPRDDISLLALAFDPPGGGPD